MIVPSISGSILVTGGAGFIGQKLIERLLNEQETRVVLYDNFVNGHWDDSPIPHPGLTVVKGDIRDRAALCRMLNAYRPRTIYHLAALHFIPYCNAHPEETLAVNVIGTQSLLDACRAVPPEQFVFASTAAVYPIREGANAEESLLDPIDVYGFSKVFGEMLVRRFAAETGVVCTVGRFFNAYGAGETNPHVIPEIIAQLQQGDRVVLGSLIAKRDYIYVEDLTDALEQFIRAKHSGYEVYNIGTGMEYSVGEVIAIMETILGRALVVEQVSQRMRSVERLHLLADISKIRQHLGWQPRFSLREGLMHTLHAYGLYESAR